MQIDRQQLERRKDKPLQKFTKQTLMQHQNGEITLSSLSFQDLFKYKAGLQMYMIYRRDEICKVENEMNKKDPAEKFKLTSAQSRSESATAKTHTEHQTGEKQGTSWFGNLKQFLCKSKPNRQNHYQAVPEQDSQFANQRGRGSSRQQTSTKADTWKRKKSSGPNSNNVILYNSVMQTKLQQFENQIEAPPTLQKFTNDKINQIIACQLLPNQMPLQDIRRFHEGLSVYRPDLDSYIKYIKSLILDKQAFQMKQQTKAKTHLEQQTDERKGPSWFGNLKQFFFNAKPKESNLYSSVSQKKSGSKCAEKGGNKSAQQQKSTKKMNCQKKKVAE